MKKVIVPALAILLISASANAQLKTTQKGPTTASSKTVLHKPVTTTASVTPAKTKSSSAVTKTGTAAKATAIRRKHPKHRKVKAKGKKM